MARVQRFDTGTLAAPVREPNGWLRVEGRSARTGILEYEDANGGVRRELVLPEELFDAASLASARLVPVTNTHPARLLDAVSARAHAVGSVGENLRADGEFLAAPLMVIDGETVAAVEAGRRELSWGYDCEIEAFDPASPAHAALVEKWGKFDGIQRGRRYNHLAIVDEARAGADARLRMDSGAARMVASPQIPGSNPSPEPENPMPVTLKIAGQSLTVDDANAPGVQQRIDAIEKAAADLTKRMDAWKARVIAFSKKWRGRFDAMKAVKKTCDECGGAKQIDGVKCDYCDGEGTVRMHDAVKTIAEPAGAEEAAPMDMEAEGEELVEDADELAVEQETETEAGAAHKDSARRRRRLAHRDAARQLRTRRDAARARRDSARLRDRVALVIEARRHLDADAKIDGVDDAGVRRLVLAKLRPAMKLDGKSPEFIAAAYEMAIADAATASVQPPAGGGGGGGGSRADAGDLPDPDAAAERRRKRLDEQAKGGKK